VNQPLGLLADSDLLPLTVPEIRRLLWRLVWPEPRLVTDILAWSIRRRRHQARAHLCHWRRRTVNDSKVRL
jgi:hypothetical protein